jgi:hypothetical protein
MTIGDFYTLFRARPAPNILHLIQPKGKDNMPLRDTILKEIQSVAASQKKTVPPLTDALPLNDSGLDSLCFAILVSRLEDITGRDPLSEAQGGRFPRTIGEFVALYEDALV